MNSSPPAPQGGANAPAGAIPRTIALLSAAAFLSGVALRICDGLLPRLAADFQLSAGSAGRVVIMFSIAYSLMQLLFGPLGDRLGKARMVSFAVTGCAVLAACAGLAPGFDALLAARVGWGMAAAGVIPLAMAWIGDAVPFEERQPTLARLLLGTLSGMMAGQLAGGLFGDSALGWRGAFLSLAACYAVVGALLLSQRRAMAAASPPPGAGHVPIQRQWRAVLASAWSRTVLLAVLAEGVFLLGAMPYLPTFLHQRFGLSLSAASGMVALYALGGLVYALSARRLVAALGQRRMVAIGGCVMGLGFLAWWLSPWAWAAAPVALAVGFGTYLYHNTLQTLATQMTPEARGTAVALFAFAFFFGQALGSSAFGWAFDHFAAAGLLLPPALGLPLAGWAFAGALARRERA